MHTPTPAIQKGKGRRSEGMERRENGKERKQEEWETGDNNRKRQINRKKEGT